MIRLESHSSRRPHRRSQGRILGRIVRPSLLALAALLSCAALAPAAQGEVVWKVDPLSSTTAVPGGTLSELVQLRNLSNTPADASVTPIVFTGELPIGFSVPSPAAIKDVLFGGFKCEVAAGGRSFTCTSHSAYIVGFERKSLEIQISIGNGVTAPKPANVATSRYSVSGGGPANPSASSVDPTLITAVPPEFGIDNFENQMTADEEGTPYTQAGGHPYANSSLIDFNTFTDPSPLRGLATPVAQMKDVVGEPPAGFLGNTIGYPQCTLAQLLAANGFPTPECLPESQVGWGLVRSKIGFATFPNIATAGYPIALFNMVPPPGVAARFATILTGVVTVVDVGIRNGTDYGLRVETRNFSEALSAAGLGTVFWGNPPNPVHDYERPCTGETEPNEFSQPCPSEVSKVFLRAPTSCTAPGEGLTTSVRADSWAHPGFFDETTTYTHELPGFPAYPAEWGPPAGVDGCTQVPFSPQISATPTTNQADSPSGLDVAISVPQDCWEDESAICDADLRDAEVTLPVGMSVNPSSAGGLAACTQAQVGVITPPGSRRVDFDEAPAQCPDASKIGTVRIQSPALEEELTGGVYLAQQRDNPFGSTLAMYLIAEAPARGVIVKQAGEIVTDPASGRLTTIFREAPQSPISLLRVSLFGGPRAALRTPPTCGTYDVRAKFTPWSGNPPAEVGSQFAIDSCPGSGFNPRFSAGTQNPLAGKYSPFSLKVVRDDGTQEISGLSARLPKGLIGKPAGIPYCPASVLASISKEVGTGAAQIASPSCPAASQVGTVTVGAGAGPNPFYTTQGRVYWAGPFKGAPLSLAVVAPVVAGPFDLGNVVVMNALRIDPETAEVMAVSDPIPTIVHGIPLDLKDVRLDLDRPDYIVNPTSCEPMGIEATIASAAGQSAQRSSHFQAAGCDRLGFHPRLSLRLSGKTNRGAHPFLRAVLTMPASRQANIASAQVTLPHAEFLDQGHIQNVCTQMQFKGAGCPTSSVLGHATAWSPLLDQPLSGPVYLMSGFGHKLPDVAADLNGQIRILLHGKVDTAPNGGIRSTFEVVPDAPVSKFVLSLKGGHRGLIQNSEDICARPQRAKAKFDAQNGRIQDFNPLLKVNCGRAARKRHR